MLWKQLDSSNIDAIAHDEGENELHVRFKNGATYIYSGVDGSKASALAAAESPTRHFNAYIKIGHPARKVVA
jgi:hypothetical protein